MGIEIAMWASGLATEFGDTEWVMDGEDQKWHAELDHITIKVVQLALLGGTELRAVALLIGICINGLTWTRNSKECASYFFIHINEYGYII